MSANSTACVFTPSLAVIAHNNFSLDGQQVEQKNLHIAYTNPQKKKPQRLSGAISLNLLVGWAESNFASLTTANTTLFNSCVYVLPVFLPVFSEGNVVGCQSLDTPFDVTFAMQPISAHQQP